MQQRHENLFYQISIFENKAVYFKSVFRGRKLNGDFFHHHIIYEPNIDEKEMRFTNCELKIKTAEKLKKDWYYVIEQI